MAPLQPSPAEGARQAEPSAAAAGQPDGDEKADPQVNARQTSARRAPRPVGPPPARAAAAAACRHLPLAAFDAQLCRAIWHAYAAKPQLQPDSGPPQEALFTAVTVHGCTRCLAEVRAALQAGASVAATDEHGRSALHIVAYENEDAEAVAAVIPVLVAEGADPQVRRGRWMNGVGSSSIVVTCGCLPLCSQSDWMLLGVQRCQGGAQHSFHCL